MNGQYKERSSLSTAPLYVCHKQVRALKIASIGPTNDGTGCIVRFEPLSSGAEPPWPCAVTPTWIEEKRAEAGGYLVEYADGYRSFSPAEAFEEGYRLVDEPPPATLTPESWLDRLRAECFRLLPDKQEFDISYHDAGHATVLAIIVAGDQYKSGSEQYRAAVVTTHLAPKHVARTAEILTSAVRNAILTDPRNDGPIEVATAIGDDRLVLRERVAITAADVGSVDAVLAQPAT